MTSEEKMDILLALDKKDSKVKITTVRGDIYYCKLNNFAEDEEDWAYHFISPDYPTHYFIMECNFMAEIEEISEEEWQKHLEHMNI